MRELNCTFQINFKKCVSVINFSELLQKDLFSHMLRLIMNSHLAMFLLVDESMVLVFYSTNQYSTLIIRSSPDYE